MRKPIRQIAAIIIGMTMIPSATWAAGYEDYLADGTVLSLKEQYTGRMEIGIPSEILINGEAEAAEEITAQCGLMICEELMRGKNVLDRGSSKKRNNPEQARLKIGQAAEALETAQTLGMTVRAATMIQPEDTPEWFFKEGWASTSKASRVDRETGLRRTENAVRDQITQVNERYPGLIEAWEVIRGGQQTEGNLFREIIGNDYAARVFRTAREAAAENQQLLWALTEFPDDEMIAQIRGIREQGWLDGVVLECRLTMESAGMERLEKTLQALAGAGLEIHLSGLEITGTDRTAAGEMRLASRYKTLFALAGEYHVKSISFPALRDGPNRNTGTPPRLINRKGRFTPAFFGALQDEMIPDSTDEEAILAAVKQTNLESIIKKEADPVRVYKKAENHNPVMTQRFGADPWAMVYQDRVYLYMTGDEPAVNDGVRPKTNDYSNIVTLRVLSSDDLVNWTDHGSIRVAGSDGAARWATNSWAPCAAWKNINGQDRFFLYFANSGGGIGVLTADSPTGPFADPLGKPLISRKTPTCDSVTWLFDPAVLVDEDGSAYLYFGGGIPEGKQADPGTARVVRLGEDMTSLAGDPEIICPPWLFEDSGINRFGDTYVYSYCTNFNVPATGSAQGFGSGEIVYMTSDNPMGPFIYAGNILKNPGTFFGVGGNNHHCIFRFRDDWYITYHAATLDRDMGWNAGYRSTFVDRLELTAEGLPAPSKGTIAGVKQLKPMDPYATVSGATAVSMAGMTTALANPEDRKAGTGPMAAVSTAPDGWTAVSGADFGPEGAKTLRMTVRSEIPARIGIRIDGMEGETMLVSDIPACESDTEISAELPKALKGMHDLYFCFSDSGISLLEWRFEK